MIPSLHITQGLPAAGKTTEARKVIANSDRRIRYTSLDNLRLMLDGQTPTAWWAPGAEESTARAQAAMVASLLASGCDVLVDGTHLFPGQLSALRKALQGQRIRVQVHDLTHVPLDTCIARDQQRPHPIGAACIRELHERWLEAAVGGWRITGHWLTTIEEEA